MANRIQTKITNFNFPNTVAKLKKDPNLYDGTIMLHDFSHPAGVTTTSGFDVHQLKRSESQYVKFANTLSIANSQDFEFSCTFYANSMDNNMTLFGWDYNQGTHLTLEPGSGTYGRIKFRLAGPNAYFIQTDEPLRAGEIHRITVKRVSNVLTCELDEQTFDMDPVLSTADSDGALQFDYIGAVQETPSSGQGQYLEQFFDGFIWDVKMKVGAQVGTSDSTIDMPGTGDNPWVNVGTGGNTYDGSTFSGPDVNDGPGYAATAVTLTRKTIGTDAIANETTIQNIASEEAAALGATDTGIQIVPSVYSDKLALSAGRGFKITNAWDTSVIGTTNTDYRLNKSVSDALIAANTAGRNVALSFWFKPNLDTFDSTNIGYFFRWGSNTSAGNYNYWILFDGSTTPGTNKIDIKPGGVVNYDSTYTSVNSGVVNVILTTSGGAYVNGTNISTTTTSTLQSFNTNEFSQEFMFSTSQHSSDRTITYLYRLNFADIDASGVTEAEWIAKEYDTGVKYIKAITDSTT